MRKVLTYLAIGTAVVSACLLTASFYTPPGRRSEARFTPVKKELRLMWKVKTGSSSFRSNIALHDNLLIMGSNGTSFMDWYLSDPMSGVYSIDRKTGRQVAHFANEMLGDMDVNGVLIHDGRLYFGNDNDEFFCTTPKGKVIWNIQTSGDIEHQPVLIENGSQKLVVFASEAGEVRAVEPIFGKTVWVYYTDDFNGWKPGDNRAVFKVSSYFRNTTSFFTKPDLVDLNEDGVNDLVYNTYNDKLIAINGVNGKAIWNVNMMEGFYNFSSYIDTGAKQRTLLYQNPEKESLPKARHTLSLLAGKRPMILKSHLSKDEYLALNTLVLPNGDCVIPTSDKLIVASPNRRRSKYIDRSQVYLFYNNYSKTSSMESRNGGGPLIGNKTFTFRGDSSCVAIVNQYDPKYPQKGVLEIVSLSRGRVLRRYELEGNIEMQPFIEDIDRDGKLDIVLNCHNNFTYCYRLEK